MQNATELIQNVGQFKHTAGSTPKTFDQQTVDATQYFFARMRSVWGAVKFEKIFPNEIDAKVAKREWANRIAKHSKQDIDHAFEHAKDMIEKGVNDWQWPNIGLILTGAKRHIDASHREYISLPEPEEVKLRRRQIGISAIAELKQKIKKVQQCA